MNESSLTVEKREGRGKGPARQLRRAGKIPGVLYGDGKDSMALAVDPKRVEAILKSRTGINTIFQLELAGEKRSAMIHEVQRNPLSHALIHADFVRINMERPVHIRVHIELQGVPFGVKTEGGFLEFLHREVELECLPADIPHQISYDVSALHVGQSIRISDFGLDEEKLRVIDEPDTVVAIVALPAAEREEKVEGEAEGEAEAAAGEDEKKSEEGSAGD